MIYDRVEALAMAEAFGAAFPSIPVHSTKSMLGQHGAGTPALQTIAACLTMCRRMIPPTINHVEPDPSCGPIKVVTEPTPCEVSRLLVHVIGLGGFYSSVLGLSAVEEDVAGQTGLLQVRWSSDRHPRFHPASDFDRPLNPWSPRSDRE